MLGIIAVVGNSLEEVLRLIVVAREETRITHSQVVTVTLLWREALVIHLLKLRLGCGSILKHKGSGSECELHLVGKD